MSVPSRPASVRGRSRASIARRIAGMLACAALVGAPIAAHADFLDTINPTNWFGGKDKYETKVINDPPPNTLYQKGVREMEKSDYETSSKTFSTMEKAYPYSIFFIYWVIM